MPKRKIFANARKMIFCLCFFSLLHCSVLAQNSNAVTGIVKSEEGTALAGASVVAKNVKTKFSFSTTTNEKGLFTFATLPARQTYSFTISYVGYETQTVTGYTVTEGAKISLAIKLKIKAEANEAVVVVGYGTQKKSSLTGSVTSVSTTQMQKQINANVASSLQGLAPGVQVIQPGGIAGADVSILIRGAASFGSTEPLYIIDGAFSNSSLSSLDPNDIESIEVLKDAAAAAIYGSRAANGVILITTKSGKKGSPVINLNTIYADQTPSKRLNYLNANQWRAFMNQVADNSGIPHDPKNDNPPNPNTNTDWQRAWLQPSPMYSATLSLSGGTNYTTYNTSIGYLDQKGMTAFSGFKKYNFRVNTTYRKNRLSVNQAFSISRQEKVPTSTITISRPTLPIFDSLGRYSSGSSVDGVVLNPLAAPFYTERKVNNTYLIGSLGVGYKIINGLEYKLNLGSSYNNFNNLTHTPVYYTYWDANGNGLSQYGNNVNSLSEIRGDQFNYNIDNLLSYKKTFRKHYLDALLGTSWYQEMYRSNSINTIADLGAPNITGTGGTVNGQINAQEKDAALLSYFARLNYDYNGRYLFSASVRNDISSKFAKDYRSGWFPSVSAGWNVQKESWFRSNFLSLLKLRASYGELGANFIDPYQFNASLRQMPSPIYSTSTSPYQVYVAQIFPINLTWETAVSKNLGVDLGFFENSLTMTIEYFERLNKGLLAKVPAPPSSGQGITQPTGGSASLVPVNSASVQNKGFDFSLAYNKRINEFNLNIIANLSTDQNKVISLGTNVPPIVGPIMSATIGDNMTITKAGFPIGSFYGFQTAGLTDSGTIRIVGVDSLGKKVFKSIRDGGPADKQIIGSPIPDFTYGFNFSGQYKNFDFTLFFQGVQGGKILNWQKLNNYFNYSGNVVTDVLNSWTPSNTNTNIPKASIPLTSQSSRPSTFFLEDGSYLRLKNLQVGYNFNQTYLSKIKVKRLRIFAGVQNLLTITRYTGYDPEVSNNTTFTRNVDLNEYPNSRSFTVGLNASF